MVTRTMAVVVAVAGAALAGPAAAGEPEQLLSFSIDGGGGRLAIEVASSGCTSKGDFTFERQGEVVTVVRRARDACKAMPFRARLEFTFAEAGLEPGKPLRVGNRFVGDELQALVRPAPGR